MKKKIILLCAAAAMTAVLAVGGTLAYLTDKTDPVTNTFAIGNVAIQLEENGDAYKQDNDGPGGGTDNTYVNWDENEDIEKVAPGQTIQKAPKVKNTGVNAAYVRVKVEYDSDLFTLVYDATQANTGDTAKEGFNDTNWEYAEIDDDGGYYYYIGSNENQGGVLAPDASTEFLFTAVRLASDFTADDEISISVEMIQANYLGDVDGPQAAFGLLGDEESDDE
jgi:predicted ribosomally synthesized peptide with SipW-like signal peptide